MSASGLRPQPQECVAAARVAVDAVGHLEGRRAARNPSADCGGRPVAGSTSSSTGRSAWSISPRSSGQPRTSARYVFPTACPRMPRTGLVRSRGRARRQARRRYPCRDDAQDRHGGRAGRGASARRSAFRAHRPASGGPAARRACRSPRASRHGRGSAVLCRSCGGIRRSIGRRHDVPSERLTAWEQGGSTIRLLGRRIFTRTAIVGDRKPLLLIHGYPTSSYDWHALWAPLAERYSLYALDMLGFGLSEKPRGRALHHRAAGRLLPGAARRARMRGGACSRPRLWRHRRAGTARPGSRGARAAAQRGLSERRTVSRNTPAAADPAAAGHADARTIHCAWHDRQPLRVDDAVHFRP